MKAILLAAGEGSRLRPFTLSKPKPMVRVANKPIAQYAVEALVANGIVDITFVVGYHRAKVQSHFGDGGRFGARITYAFQEALVGTAHAVGVAAEPHEPFIVLAADNVIRPALLAELLEGGSELPAVVLHRAAVAGRYGIVETVGDHVARIVEAPARPQADWVSTGIYLFPAEFYRKIAARVEDGHLGLPDVVGALIDDGQKFRAVKTSHSWSDAVHPWDLLRLHAEMLRGAPMPAPQPQVVMEKPCIIADATIGPHVVIGAGTCIGRNVDIGAGSILENCIIYDDAHIGPGSLLRNTIVGEGSRTGPRFTAIAGEADVITSEGWYHLEDFGAVIGEDVVIGGNVTLLPGAILSNRVRVDHGRTIGKFVEENARVY